MNTFSQSKPLNFLIVEDNPSDFFLLKETIHMSGIHVGDILLADTISSALQQLEKKPDIVFLDLFLPDCSGPESFIRLKDHMPHPAVIVLSGISDIKVAREAIAQGAQDFLAKGEFDERLLEKSVMYSLERKALARQQALFKALVERSPNMKTMVSPDGTILYSTPAITTVLGYSEKEFIGFKESQFVHPADINKLNEVINQTISNPDYIGKVQLRVLHKDGHYIWCDKTITNLLHDPYVNAIVCNLWDISREKTSEEIIRMATIKGQEKERAQLGLELHDNINQILATANLYLDFAMPENPEKRDILLKSKEFISMAVNEIRKLSHTLLPPALEEFGLVMALNELVNPLSATSGLQIEKHWDTFREEGLEKEQKLTIYRIAQEQLNNIIKHANARKVDISLRLIGNGDSIELTIKDDGDGFDQSEKRSGVGLRNIISRAGLFGGHVSVCSKPGDGCELKVVFPCSKAAYEEFNIAV